MDLISRYVLADQDERKVLQLAVRRPGSYTPEEQEFFINRYGPTYSFMTKTKEHNDLFDIKSWNSAVCASSKECIAEARRIITRKPDYKNLIHNIGLTLIDLTVGGLVTMTGAMGGGVRWIPADRKQQYLEERV